MFETNRRLRRQRDEAQKLNRQNHSLYEKVTQQIHRAMELAEKTESALQRAVAERDALVTKNNDLWELVRNLRGEGD